MKKKNILLSIIWVAMLVSCGTDSSLETDSVVEGDWCNEVLYGTFEGTTEDGVKASVTFERIKDGPLYDTDGFYVEYTLPNGEYMAASGPTMYEGFLQFEGTVEDIKRNNPIILEPSDLYNKDGWFQKDEFNAGKIKVTYLSSNEIKLEFGKIQSAISTLMSSNVDEEVNNMVLTKVNGMSDCYDFDPMISYDNVFTEDEVMFINGLTMVGEPPYILAKKETMMDYMLKQPSGNSMGYWNKALEEYGSLFRIDFNGDGANDLCGYFSSRYNNDESLVFKIYLNNGASFTEAYSKNMSDYEGGDDILVPGKMNGNDIIESSYLDMAGYYIFYNKLTQEIEQAYYD